MSNLLHWWLHLALTFLILSYDPCSANMIKAADAKSTATAEDELSTPEISVAEVIAAAAKPFRPAPLAEVWQSQRTVRLYSGLAISHDGSRVLACLRSGGYIVLHGETGKELIHHPQPLAAPILFTALAYDGRHAAFGLKNRTVVVVDLEKDRILHTHAASTNDLLGVHISDDNTRVSWFDKSLTLRTAPLAGGEIAEMTYPDESKQTSNINPLDLLSPDNLNSPLNLVRKDQIEAILFKPDGLVAMIVPMEHSSVYAELHVRWQGNPGKHEKIRSKGGTLRKYAIGSEFGVLLNVHGSFEFSLRAQPKRSTVTTAALTRLCDSRVRLGITNTQGKWCFLVGEGQVDVRDVDYPEIAHVYDYPVDAPQQIAIAPDGHRFAVVDSRGLIRTFTIATPRDSPGLGLVQTIRKLVKQRQFKKLDELYVGLNNQLEPFSWHDKFHNSTYMNNVIYRRFKWYEESPPIDELLDQWLAANPSSHVARTIRAEVLIERGWDARGNGVAFTVSPKGWQTFEQSNRDARKVILPVVKSEQPTADAFFQLFLIAKAAGWDEIDMRPYLERVEELYPHDIMSHVPVIERLLPRWHGGPRDAVQYAEKIARKRGPGEGDAFYAHMANIIGHYHPNNELFNELGFDYQRIQTGWKYIEEHDPRPGFGLHGSLWFADLKNDTTRMDEIWEKLLRMKIPYSTGIIQDRRVYEQLLKEHRHPNTRGNQIKPYMLQQ